MFEFYINPKIIESGNTSDWFFALVPVLLSVWLTSYFTAKNTTNALTESLNADKEKERENRNRTEIEHLNYVLELIELSLNYFESFKKFLDSLIDENKAIENKILIDPEIEIKNSLIRLCKIVNQEKLYICYVNQFNSKELLEVFKYFDSFYENTENFLKEYDRIIDLLEDNKLKNDLDFYNILKRSLQRDQELGNIREYFRSAILKGYLSTEDISKLSNLFIGPDWKSFIPNNSDAAEQVEGICNIASNLRTETIAVLDEKLSELMPIIRTNIRRRNNELK